MVAENVTSLCPVGWQSAGANDTNCYLFSDARMAFRQAELACAKSAPSDPELEFTAAQIPEFKTEEEYQSFVALW